MRLSNRVKAPERGPFRTKYPFFRMKVGQSLFVPEADFPPCGSAAVRAAAWSYGKKRGWSFTTRREKGGYRVWRVK